MTRRTQRVGNLIRDTVGQVILTGLADPRIDRARTSITRVDIPEDLLAATVYVSVLGTEIQQRLAVRALNHAAGHVQELMMRQISLRHTPRLTFELDENFQRTLDTFETIERAMQEIKEKERAQQATDPIEQDSPANG
ncbi:MAG: 30S ribosome-binding factor RbfA [Phycisphaerae bacterium]|nr:30S ribosome-binding factor RbfA [Phycisphaerae bacterium]